MVLLSIFVSLGCLSADETAITESGKHVLLRDDGTWELLEDTSPPIGDRYWKFTGSTGVYNIDNPRAVGGVDITGRVSFITGATRSDGAIRVGRDEYLRIRHGIGANGGGTRVNRYTIAMDIRLPAIGHWHSLFQTNLDNSDDVDCAISPGGKLGIGDTGYSEQTIAPRAWHRVVIAAENGENGSYRIYVDGELFLDGDTSELDDPRFSLDPEHVLLFADDDGEDNMIEVSTLATFKRALSQAEIGNLGSIPVQPRTMHEYLAGRWLFDNTSKPLDAVFGKALEISGSHSLRRGISSGDGAVTLEQGSFYRCSHGIGSNGAGERTNEYTFVADVMIEKSGEWYSLIQTDPENESDAEIFVNPSGELGVGDSGYSPAVIEPGKWHRVAVSVAAVDFYNFYVDGRLVYEGDPPNPDDRFSLDPDQVLLFADDDGEDNRIHVSGITIYEKALSSQEIVALGPAGVWN